MILKVACTQPVFDHHKHDLQKPKDGFNKNKTASFASILENIIKSQTNEK